VLLESQPEDADALVFEDPKGLHDLFDEAVHLLAVDSLDLFQKPKIVADLLGDLDEGAQVLGKTTAAEAERRIKEAAANALVHAHAVGDFLDIRAGGLADDGDGVDVGD